MRLVSLNLRFAYNAEMNNQGIREPRVLELVKSYRPAFMGVQECEKFWHERLVATIGNLGYIPAQPEAVGEDGKYAFKNYIWYDSEAVELIDSGAMWLSETPDVPSRGFGSRFYISSGYAVMKIKATGECVAYINTHLDVHGEETRKSEIGVIKAKVKELSDKGYPVFVTGDFNDYEGSAVYLGMTEELHDARKTAKKSSDKDTFNGYSAEGVVFPEENWKRIDFCFYNDKVKSIDEFRVVEQCQGGYISDHNALVIDATL